MKNSRLASWKTALPFLLPSLAGFVVFSIIPMIMQIFVSLTSWDGLSELTLFSDFSGFMNRFYVGIENYKEILTSKEFYQVIGNTLEFVILYIIQTMQNLLIENAVLMAGIVDIAVVYQHKFRGILTNDVAGARNQKMVDLRVVHQGYTAELAAVGEKMLIFLDDLQHFRAGPHIRESTKERFSLMRAPVLIDQIIHGLMVTGHRPKDRTGRVPLILCRRNDIRHLDIACIPEPFVFGTAGRKMRIADHAVAGRIAACQDRSMCRVGYRRVDAPDMPDVAGVLKILFGVPAAAQVLKILIHHRIHGKD